MKTIEITSGNQTAQFTTKSVTVGGKEYFYANMANVENDIVNHIYTFTYDGEFRTLPYEAKDAKVLNAIFSQVQNLKPQQMTTPAAAPATSQATTPAAAPAQAAVPTPPTAPATVPTTKPAPPAAAPAPEQMSGEMPAAAKQPDSDEKPAAQPAELPEGKAKSAEQPSEEKAGGKLRVTDIFGRKKEKAAAAQGSAEALMDTGKADAAQADSQKSQDADPEKKARLNKSMKIFGIIIAAVLVVSVIYYFVVGTPTDPAPANPNSTESQQYDDIDELIDDLQ